MFKFGIDKTTEVDMFFTCTDCIDFNGTFKLFDRIKDNIFDFKFITFDFREVENVVDNLKKVLGAFFDNLDKLLLLLF